MTITQTTPIDFQDEPSETLLIHLLERSKGELLEELKSLDAKLTEAKDKQKANASRST